jgi:hypothetical protein
MEGEIDPQLSFLSDEARFHWQQYINTQNNRYRVLLNPVKVGVWYAVGARRIVGYVCF